jgi:hypothetical protein
MISAGFSLRFVAFGVHMFDASSRDPDMIPEMALRLWKAGQPLPQPVRGRPPLGGDLPPGVALRKRDARVGLFEVGIYQTLDHFADMRVALV